METSQDVQNEGWVFNREECYPLPVLDNGTIPIGGNMLRVDISDGQWLRTTDVVKREGKLYNKMNHSYYFDKPIKADITWLFPFEDLPSAFKRYITAKAATRAATQMVGNPQLTQLLASQEALTRLVLSTNVTKVIILSLVHQIILSTDPINLIRHLQDE